MGPERCLACVLRVAVVPQGRTSAALAALAALAPATATRVVLDEANGAVLETHEVRAP